MKVVGITGSSGSGKTTVSTIIKNNTGCKVISADSMAKKLNNPGTEYYDETIKLFGTEILDENQKINRKKLASILFTQEELRKKMNEITAKYVGSEIKRIINAFKRKKENEIVVVDAPLLFECGLDSICDYIIAVVCEEDALKVQRICNRDKIRTSQAKTRLKAQPSDEFYTSRANYVINNSREVAYAHLIKKVIKIVHEIKGDNEKN